MSDELEAKWRLQRACAALATIRLHRIDICKL